MAGSGTFTALRGPLRAEWLKLTTVRSTYVVVVSAVVLGLGIGWIDVESVVHQWATLSAADRASFDPVMESFSGFEFAELAFAAFGVLAVSTEYATGLARTTALAVPRRGVCFAAKALVLGGFSLFVAELAALAAYLLGQHVLSARHLDVRLADPQALRAVGCAGLYLTVVTLVGFGLGALLRHTAAAMTVMFGLVFLAWPVARAVEGFTSLPDRLLLVNIADRLTGTTAGLGGAHPERVPSMTAAVAGLILYAVSSLALGAWRASRDVG
jgi:ABC-2 type transport system permease protein